MRVSQHKLMFVLYTIILLSILTLSFVGQLYHSTDAKTSPARPADACTAPTWCTVSSPNQSGSNILYGATNLANNDAWSVGIYNDSYTGGALIAEHWDGSAWVTASPASVTGDAGFFSTAAISATDIWAVGFDNYIGTVQLTLAQHWNGSSWSKVTSPNGDAAAGNVLAGVAAISSNDVWAVGAYNRSGSYSGDGIDFTLAEHWNGSSWSKVSSPNVNAGSSFNTLNAVAAVSSSDVWAVGDYTGGYLYYSGPRPLIEHWDGSSWSIAGSLPDPGEDAVLNGIAAFDTNNVWAVGTLDPYGSPQPLVMHWDGSSWTIASSLPEVVGGQLQGITITPEGDIWAVGSYLVNCTGDSCPPDITPTEEWGVWGNDSSAPSSSATATVSSTTAIHAPKYHRPASMLSLVPAPLVMHWQGAANDDISAWAQVEAAHPSTSGGLYAAASPLLQTRGGATTTRLWGVGYSSDLSSDSTLADTGTGLPPCAPAVSTTQRSRDQLGNDIYQVDFCDGAAVPSLHRTLDIARYYGPLSDTGAVTGTISTGAEGVSVAPTVTLSVLANGISPSEAVTVTINGHDNRLTAIGGNAYLTATVPITELILPRKGTLTSSSSILTGASAPPTATNYLTITRSPGAGVWTQLSVRLFVRGLTPLVLENGFDANVTSPDNLVTAGDPSLWWSGTLLTEYLPGVSVSSPHDPNNDQFIHFASDQGHASIPAGGQRLAWEINWIATAYGVSKVNVVGYGMGGLWGREATTTVISGTEVGELVGKLVMLGSPNAGSYWADQTLSGGGLSGWLAHLDQAISQLSTLSVLLYDATAPHQQVAGVDYIAEAGAQTTSGGGTVAADGFCTVCSAYALPYGSDLSPVVITGTGGTQALTADQLRTSEDTLRNISPYLVLDGISGSGVAAAAQVGSISSSTNSMLGSSGGQASILDAGASQPQQISGPILSPLITDTIGSGQTETHTVTVDEADKAIFLLGRTTQSDALSLTLHDPLGEVITPTSSYTGSAYIPTINGEQYIIAQPLTGSWQLVVQPITVTGSTTYYLSTGFVGGVQLAPQVSSLGTPKGQPVVISTTVADDLPITGATVTATVTAPDQSSQSVSLAEDSPPDGGYTGTYTPTLEGSYQVRVTAAGVNSEGTSFSRLSTTSFQASSAARLTGSFNSMAYDTNGDGLYNNLTLTATVAVTDSGQYRLSGDLTMTDTNQTLVASSSSVYSLSSGTISLTLPFDGKQIASALYDGAYQVHDLSLTRVLTDEELALSSYNTVTTTQVYSRDIWQRDNVLLAGAATDYGEDTNNNGLYEYLDVVVPVDIRDAGTYSITANLDSITGTVATAYTSTVGVVSGTNQLLLRFNGGAIATSGIDGPYSVTDLVVWRKGQYDSAPIRVVLRRTNVYSYAGFEAP